WRAYASFWGLLVVRPHWIPTDQPFCFEVGKDLLHQSFAFHDKDGFVRIIWAAPHGEATHLVSIFSCQAEQLLCCLVPCLRVHTRLRQRCLPTGLFLRLFSGCVRHGHPVNGVAPKALAHTICAWH